MKTAALYARVSSDRQKEEQTIASQTSALRAYAAEHEYLVPDGCACSKTRAGAAEPSSAQGWSVFAISRPRDKSTRCWSTRPTDSVASTPIRCFTKAGPPVAHARVSRGAASILPEHRTAMLGAVRGVRARLYYQRQSLWELGPAAEGWLTEVIHRRPTQWRQDVEHCFTLLQEHGPERLLTAFSAGVRQRAIGAEYVAARLRGLAAARREPRRVSRSDVEQGGRYLAIPLNRVSEAAR